MSQFTGKQFKGAMSTRRAVKRDEATKRNNLADAKMRRCGHVHGESIECGNPAVSA